MKKKITAIFLCVALVAIAVVGASLAYFIPDTKTATNTFTRAMSRLSLMKPTSMIPRATVLPATNITFTPVLS